MKIAASPPTWPTARLIGNLNFAIGEQVIKELTKSANGKTLIAVTHDERLAKYFDIVIDMNEMTGGITDVISPKEGEL